MIKRETSEKTVDKEDGETETIEVPENDSSFATRRALGTAGCSFTGGVVGGLMVSLYPITIATALLYTGTRVFGK
jgi:hypothetical protein